MTKILLIEKDQNILKALQTLLAGNGYYVFTAESEQAGLKIAWQQALDIVVLDLAALTVDSFETCRRLRQLDVASILVQSSSNDKKSIIKVLEMGADDYLEKPVPLPVLLAKIRTLLRRRSHQAAGDPLVYDDGYLSIDLHTRCVEIHRRPVSLTPTEFHILAILTRKLGQVVSHEELIAEIWGTEKEAGLNSLKLYIHYIRQKIEDDPRKPYYLLAEWGIGYRLREPNQEAALS